MLHENMLTIMALLTVIFIVCIEPVTTRIMTWVVKPIVYETYIISVGVKTRLDRKPKSLTENFILHQLE